MRRTIFSCLAIAVSVLFACCADAFQTMNVGITGAWVELKCPADGPVIAIVKEVEPDSPAHGKLELGDVISAVNGRDLEGKISIWFMKEADPRRILGEALGKAEATDGRLVFAVMRGERALDVTLNLPVLGGYSKTWPVDCRKSDVIIDQSAAYLKRVQREDGRFYDYEGSVAVIGNCFGGLFMLATDTPEGIAAAARYADYLTEAITTRGVTPSHWAKGYQGIFLAEYYLKTGDKSVKKPLAAICQAASASEAFGAWGHSGTPEPGYSMGGVMTLASVPIFSTLILARECDVAVDEGTFKRSLAYFSRFAGQDGSSYGDQRGDGGISNGKDGATATAFALLPGKEYKQISELMALHCADSYFGVQVGHGGHRFNAIWRGIAMAHLPDQLAINRRRHMDELAWFYDLSRLSGGGFNLLPRHPYAPAKDFASGIGMAMAYIAPRHTLRITGGKPTPFSLKKAVPAYAWGGKHKRDFLRSDYCKGGEKNRLTPVELEAYKCERNKIKSEASVEMCGLMMRHYLTHIRKWGSNQLSTKGTPEAFDEIEKALKHSDARVRRSGMNAIVKYVGSWFTADEKRINVPQEVVARRYMPYIAAVLDDPQADWWEIDGAMFALSRAGADQVRKYLPILKRYAVHQEMWLRQSAFYAIANGLNKEIDAESMLFLAERYAQEGRQFARMVMVKDLKFLIRSSGVHFDQKTQQQLARILSRPMTNTRWAYGYVENGDVSRKQPFQVMKIAENFRSEELVHFIKPFIGVIDSWSHRSFLDNEQLNFCNGLLGKSIGMGEQARPLVERIARIHYNNPGMHRGSKMLVKRIDQYEKKFGEINVDKDVLRQAQKLDTRALAEGLIGYWQFDEGEGVSSRDASQKSNEAQLKGGAQWADGLIGHSIRVSKGQWAEVPGYSDPVTDGRIQNLSLSFWIQTKDAGSGRIGKGSYGEFKKTVATWMFSNDAYAAGWDVRLSDGAPAFITGAFDNGQHGLSTIENKALGIPGYMFEVTDDGKRWHHVVMVYDGSKKTFEGWVDGNPTGKTTRWNAVSIKDIEKDSYIIPALDAVLTIGGKYEKEGKVESFDEIAIWERVLNAKEVKMLYNNGFGSAIDIAPVKK